MIVQKALQQAQPQGQQDPEEAGEDPREEASETPDQEAQEEQQEGPDSDGDESGDSDSAANVSPEDQAMYNAVVIAAETLIYAPEYRAVTLQKLKQNSGNMPLAIGHTAAMIVLSIQGGADKEGQKIPDDVLFAAGQEVVADLLEVSIAAKLVPEKDQQDLFRQSLFIALREYGNGAKVAGYITPDTQTEAKGAITAMVAQASQGKGAKGGAVAAAQNALQQSQPPMPQQAPQQMPPQQPQPQGA